MPDWKIYEDKSTLELIKLIQKREIPSFEETAQAAFRTFVFRFTQQLSQKNEIICKNWGYSVNVAIEVTHRTFKKFWKYPKFNVAKTNTADVDIAVILYLLGIARNVLSDYVNQLNGIDSSPYNGRETIVWDFPVDQSFDDPLELNDRKTHAKVVREALATLSEKHKVIFLTYKKYENGTNKLPRKLLAEIRKQLGISQPTVRVYKFEAYNKVNQHLEFYGLKKS
jgi:DNA-directed RNA polymerase specialized sigma24 family protein